MSRPPEISDFREFFRAVNDGHCPFPWQENLVAEVAETKRWPDVLDLPTAAGKTAVIDIAVFLHAMNFAFPRRIVFVIDRRVVVQQAAERARKLAGQLAQPTDPVVRLVADRLRRKACPKPDDRGQTPPLQWAELRGGIVRDDSWAMRPDVPAVIVSTVDQVGSRLLFRGYGSNPRMWPVQAGLLANDALFLLDEVHLARPFAETLRAIATRYRPPGAAGLPPDRWQVVELSATPGVTADDLQVFRLSDRDGDREVAPRLVRRVKAVKRAHKEQVNGHGESALAKRAAQLALEKAASRPGMVVGVIVNRVNTACLVFGELSKRDAAVDRCLITGRMRPFDRDDRLGEVKGRIRTGRDRSAAERSLVVVGTQSVEAGADFDFDALITECASYDALRQRFGRVDRDGDLSAVGEPSESVILARAEDIKTGDDPIYGKSLARTWNWLPDEIFDFAPLAPDPGTLEEITVSKPHAPVLLPSHLDRWVQTSPVPDADPDVAQWLHGLADEAPADVNVIWRADITEQRLASLRSADLVDLVSACPPGSAEAMPVPLGAVRSWLAAGRDEEVQVADLEGVAISGTESESARMRPVIRWQGDESSVVKEPRDITPGSTIIVPSEYGGVEAGNWAPGADQPVTDFGHRVQLDQRHRAVLRLSTELFPSGLEVPLPRELDTDPYASDDKSAIGAWLTKVSEDGLSTGNPLDDRIIAWLGKNRSGLDVHRTANDEIFTLTCRQRLGPADVRTIMATRTEQEASDAEAEPETSSFTGCQVTLADHSQNVADWAELLATSCGLTGLVTDLKLAGKLHDLGKADPRFQDVLRNGRVTGEDLLAKSGQRDLTLAERRRAYRHAGYPSGGRHELLSLALVQTETALASAATDWDLVLHLVASHHGVCRPFAPVVQDRQPVSVRVSHDHLTLEHSSATGAERSDSGVADRFWRLVRRYGWFGLAWLECLLRLADHRASEQEQRNG
jgi:CRISPR-associated endonuclease/helicase Cas3